MRVAFGHAGHQEHARAVDHLAAGLGELARTFGHRTNPVALDQHVPVEGLVPVASKIFAPAINVLLIESAPLSPVLGQVRQLDITTFVAEPRMTRHAPQLASPCQPLLALLRRTS